jgi:acid phosphatase type 7
MVITMFITLLIEQKGYVSSSTCPECQSAFEPLFIKYGVDVVLHGHKHFYERQAAVHPSTNGTGIADPNGLNNPSAPWYIINGAAGHYDGLDVPNSPPVATSRNIISSLYGWSYFTVHNCTHLTQSFVPSSTGVFTDTVTLYKNRTCSSNKGGKGGNGGHGGNGENGGHGGHGGHDGGNGGHHGGHHRYRQL